MPFYALRLSFYGFPWGVGNWWRNYPKCLTLKRNYPKYLTLKSPGSRRSDAKLEIEFSMKMQFALVSNIQAFS